MKNDFTLIHKQSGISKIVLLLALVIAAVAGLFLMSGEDLKKAATLKSAELIGNIAVRSMPDDAAGGFHKIPIEVRQLSENVYQATGIANSHMIVTDDGNVLFDSGIAIQAAKQLRLMKEKSDAPVSHIRLSHSHADHIGGTQFWQEENTEIVTHREYVEEQRYLKSLENYQWRRNRVLFPWMPETPSTVEWLEYGGIEPTILVDEHDYRFDQGGVEFHVLSTPGAEGADNISLWLPQQKILFTGDTLGPLFPQFPNLFTITGLGSPSVLCNMLVAIEQHVNWVGDCITYLKERDIDAIEPSTQSETRWIAHVNEVAEGTMFTAPSCNSWYLGANIEGKPRIFMPYVGGFPQYRSFCEAEKNQGYPGFNLMSTG